MTKANVNGIEIDYQEYGEGDAIVFAHGAGGNLLSWWQQIPYFSHSYRCITFSHRGFGHSPDIPGGPGASAFVEDLEALWDHLGIQSAHLVAQSMGGRTALGFAAAHPDRTMSLVLADTTGGMDEPDVLAALTEWREGHSSTREIGVRATAPGFGTRRPDLANLYLQISRTNPPRPQTAGVMSGGPSGAVLSRMSVPTMFIVGEEDDLIPPHVIELASRHIADSVVVRVPEAGHSVYFEQPEVFNFQVLRFIRHIQVRDEQT